MAPPPSRGPQRDRMKQLLRTKIGDRASVSRYYSPLPIAFLTTGFPAAGSHVLTNRLYVPVVLKRAPLTFNVVVYPFEIQFFT